MPYDIVTIPCLSDNYAYLLRDQDTQEVAVIDVPEAGPILKALEENDWALSQIWLTHHHPDHIDGVADVLEEYAAKVFGAQADAHRLPPLDQALAEGDAFNLGNYEVQIIDVPGHTVGHIAFHVPEAKLAFTADSLMALGCGRLFEGTPAQMWESLQKLAALPDDTVICSGHEYTASNAKFALTIDPQNAVLISRSAAIDAARQKGEATVPSLLSLEMQTNPFLRPADPGIRANLGMPDATDTDVFTEIRARKDAF